MHSTPDTYMGVFDDMVQKYPWPVNIDDQYLMQTVIRHVLFGGRILLNDGYLAMHPSIVKSIKSKSIIYMLIREGYIRILSADEDVAGSIRKRAESGVDSFKRLLDGPDWRELDVTLGFLSKRQTQLGAFMRWPQFDMTHGYMRACRRLRGKKNVEIGLRFTPEKTLDYLLDSLEYEIAQSPYAPRTKWEKISQKLARDDKLGENSANAICELMQLANENYHVNFAACLGAQTGTDIQLESAYTPAFEELYDVSKAPILPLDGTQGSEFPIIDFPISPERLMPFLHPGEPAHEQKIRFLSALSSDDPIAFSAARDEYTQYLSEHFQIDAERFAAKKYTDAISIFLFSSGTIADAAIGGNNGLEFGLIALVTGMTVAPQIVKRFALGKLRQNLAIQPLEPKIIDLRERIKEKKAIASIGLSKEKARELTNGLPQYG